MDSLIKVSRYNFKPDWTIGKLLIKNNKGVYEMDGYTVEDEIREVKIKGETAVPYGIYELGYRDSPKFSTSFLYSESLNKLIEPAELRFYSSVKDFKAHQLIWIKNIPNFEYVLIHWGNSDDDTDGCLIVGSGLGVIKGQEGVINSRAYYKALYPRIFPLIKKSGQTIEYTKS